MVEILCHGNKFWKWLWTKATTVRSCALLGWSDSKQCKIIYFNKCRTTFLITDTKSGNFFGLISLCVLNSFLLKHCVLVGKGLLLYTELKMYGLGLDKCSVVFIEWEIGKMEAANFYHKLITYIILNTPKRLWNISKIKNWFYSYMIYRCHWKSMSPEEGQGVPQNSD